MVKTQVQIPYELYAEAKRVSKEYEMSFAEVVRRGLERLVPYYPPLDTTCEWKMPKVEGRGSYPIANEDLKDIAQGWDTLPAGLAPEGGEK